MRIVAGGGVARVGEQRFAGFLALLVDPRERRPRQEHLAADLDASRRAPPQRQRNRPDGPDVGGDVLAANAVAAGRAAHQAAVLVGQRDAQAVDLQLGDVCQRCRPSAGPFRTRSSKARSSSSL